MPRVQYYTDDSGLDLILGGSARNVWVRTELVGSWCEPVWADSDNAVESSNGAMRFRTRDMNVGVIPQENFIVQYYTDNSGISMINHGEDYPVWVQENADGSYRNPVYADRCNIVDTSSTYRGRVSFNTEHVTIGEVPTDLQSNTRLLLWTNGGGIDCYNDGYVFSCRGTRHGEWCYPLTIDSNAVGVERLTNGELLYRITDISSIILDDRNGSNPLTWHDQQATRTTTTELGQLLDSILVKINEYGVK